MELNSVCPFTLELNKLFLGNILANKLDPFFAGRLLVKVL